MKLVAKFIESFQGFTTVGTLLSFWDEHQRLWQHIDNVTWLQMLAFMPAEETAPFVDIHVEGVKRSVLIEAFSEKAIRTEFVKWAMLICWRKVKNGDEEGAREMLQNFIIPSFPNTLAKTIKSNPVAFFKSRLRTGPYKAAASFLTSQD